MGKRNNNSIEGVQANTRAKINKTDGHTTWRIKYGATRSPLTTEFNAGGAKWLQHTVLLLLKSSYEL